MFVRLIQRIIILIICSSIFSSVAFSQITEKTTGNSLTSGTFHDFSSPYSSQATPSSPINREFLPENYFGISLLGVHGFYEIGDVSNILDKIDKINKKTASDADSITKNDIDEVNDFISALGKDGYIFFDAQVNLLSPVVFSTQSNDSMWSIELSGNVGGKIGFVEQGNLIAGSRFPACDAFYKNPTNTNLDDCGDEIRADPSCNFTTNADAFSKCKAFDVTTDSYFELKGYQGPVFKLGYSRYIETFSPGSSPWVNFDLFIGGRYKYHLLDLYEFRYSPSLESEDEDFEGKINDNKVSSSLHDFSVSATAISENYQVTFGVDHLISSSLDYKIKSVDLSPGAYLTGSLYNFADTGRQFAINFYHDFTEETTLYGEKNKWTVINAVFSMPKWYVPSVRFGRRYSGVRDNLGYTQLGLTLFRFLSMNVAISDKELEDSTPRSAFASLSFDVNI